MDIELVEHASTAAPKAAIAVVDSLSSGAAQALSALSFRRNADGGSPLAARSDVTFAYNLILGREPENTFVVDESTAQPIESIVQDMLASIEFQALVKRLFRTPHEESEEGFAAPLAQLSTWLKTLLVAPEAFFERLTACQSWRELILKLLEEDFFAHLVPTLDRRPARAEFSVALTAIAVDPPTSPGAAAALLSVEEIKSRILAGRLFDARWYGAKNRLTFDSPEAALEHYLTRGAPERLEPNPLFDSRFYRDAYMRANERDQTPFLHYISVGMDRDYAPSPLIRPTWVRAQLEQLRLTDGVLSAILHKSNALRLDPHPCFSTRFYLSRYPEIAARRAHPLAHYLQNGWRERRAPHPLFWPDWFTALNKGAIGDADPLTAYIYDRALHAAHPNPYFHPEHYFGSEAVNPLLHFLENWKSLDTSPNSGLDVAWAREAYRVQLKALQTDPLSFLLTNANGFVYGNPHRRTLAVKTEAAGKSVEAFRQNMFGAPASATRRRRLVYISHNLKIQGAQTSLFELACGMARQPFHDVVVLAPDEGPMMERYRTAGISVRKYRLPVAGMADEVHYRKLFETFTKQICDLEPDLVHGNTIQAYHAIVAASNQGIPTFWNIRESEEPASHFGGLTAGAQGLLGRAIESPTDFVFVSRTTRDLWLNAYPKMRASTINNGLNYDNMLTHSRHVDRAVGRSLFDVGESEVMIFNVGTWTERKGQLDVIEAVRKMDRRLWSRLRIVMIGANESEYGLQTRSALSNLPQSLRDRFKIYRESASAADRALVYSAFRAADIFAFTSRIESYPRVVNEALYFGLPLVSTPCFGVIEQVEPGVSGLFYEAGDTPTLARHFEDLVVNSQRRHALASAARHAAIHKVMQYDQMLNRYQELYNSRLAASAV